MPQNLARAPRRAILSALVALVLLPVAGCGGDETTGSGSGSGLARFAPANAPFYVEAAVRPDGDLKTDLDAFVAKFAPGKDLDRLVGKAVTGSQKIDFERDVKPWLGERAAVTVTSLPAGAGDTPDVAAIVETTDADKAMATLRKGAAGAVEERAYGGVDYLVEAGNKKAGGIVDDTLVVGTEPALKAVVDASKGKGLDTNGAFSEAIAAVDEGAIALVYGDIRRAFDLARSAKPGSIDAQQLESVRELLDRRGIETFASGLQVSGSALKVRVAATSKADGQGDEPTKLLADLPAGAWAALALGDLGKSISTGLDSLEGLAGPGFDVQSGLDLLEQQAGIDVQKDLLSWMGQTGLFVRGTSLTDIGGALVVQSKDAAATKAALAKARTFVADAGLPAQDLTGNGIDDGFSVKPGGAPFEIFAALAGDRFVLAVNRQALDDAIDPAKKLSDDDAFKAGAELLGDGMQPSFYLDVPKVAGLIGLAASGQQGYARAEPYLDRIGTITAGSKREGDLQLQTFAVGIR